MNTWMTYNGVNLRRLAGGPAYAYQTSNVGLDADGAPNAYGPHGSGLDYEANAGYPGNWRNCLAPDPRDPSRPFRQTSGLYAGCFVSKTSLEDPTRPAFDIARYVSSTEIPYIVFPGSFYLARGTGSLGDLVMVRNRANGMTSAAIVADIGPSRARLGEMSLALATALGGRNPNPRNGAGAPQGTMRYVVFPGSRSRPSWPLTKADIDARAQALLDAAGGWSAVDALFTA